MNTPTQTPASGSSKPLWAAMLVLVVVVLAMGATLIRIQSQPIEPRMVVLPEPSQTQPVQATTGESTPGTPAQPAVSAAAEPSSAAAPAASKKLEANMPLPNMDKAQADTNNIANQAIEITAQPRPVLPRQPEPAVARFPAKGVSLPAQP
jgi:cytoskeletal protein RodZ